jgi:hypothetical protein
MPAIGFGDDQPVRQMESPIPIPRSLVAKWVETSLEVRWVIQNVMDQGKPASVGGLIDAPRAASQNSVASGTIRRAAMRDRAQSILDF